MAAARGASHGRQQRGGQGVAAGIGGAGGRRGGGDEKEGETEREREGAAAKRKEGELRHGARGERTGDLGPNRGGCRPKNLGLIFNRGATLAEPK